MYDQDRQSKAIECLTKYLQYFKTYFSLSFSLIECHAFPAKFNNVQLENATLKVTNKKFGITFQQSPFNLWIGDNGKSYIDRFYMRIVEFLEFRLNIFKGSDADLKLTSIIDSFIASLHKFFKTLTSKEFQKDRQRIVIGQVFFQIEAMVKKLVNSIFGHLEKIHQKKSFILEQIQFSKKLIGEEVLSMFTHMLEELQKEQESENYYIHGDSFVNQIYEDGKMIPKPRSKSDFRVENFYSVGSKSLRESKMNGSNHFFHFRKIYSNATEIQMQKSQNLTKKSKFAQNLSIMDIEDVEVYSRDYIMQELQRKNATNKQMIKKFIQVSKRKGKKHKHKIEFIHQAQEQDKKDQLIKKTQILNFEKKSKSQLNVAIVQEKIPGIPMIKGNSIFSDNSTGRETVKTQKIPKPMTQNNISNALYLMEEKKDQKSRSQSIRQQITKKSTVNQNPEFETNKETFTFKEKQKMYFQSLKNKMNFQNQKITKKLQSMRSQNESTVRKIDNISMPSIIQTSSDDYRKIFRNNIKKHDSKGSRFLSNKIYDRIKPSNSVIFSKNQLTSGTIDSKMVSLEGSSLCKRMPKRGKLMKFLQKEDKINSTLVQEINRVSNRNLSKVSDQSYVEPDSSVLVLPRISSNKKEIHAQK